MKTMRCLDCYWYKWSFLTGKHTATRSTCGLHGGADVTPGGPQQNLNNRGSCGFLPLHKPTQLSLF